MANRLGSDLISPFKFVKSNQVVQLFAVRQPWDEKIENHDMNQPSGWEHSQNFGISVPVPVPVLDKKMRHFNLLRK